jgi:hypothetical protein
MLKFYAMNSEAIERNSLVRASEVSFNWVDKIRAYLDGNFPISEYPKYPPRTTKCPAIFSIMGTGWILKSYIDFSIKTNGDGSSFIARFREDTSKFNNVRNFGTYVKNHPPEQLFDFKPTGIPTLKSVLKIHSPWMVDIPEGYSLLMMPVPYSDETRFTAATGLLKGKQVLNIQMYWHCLNSEEHIPAGTPLNQMILVKDEKIEHSIELMENEYNIWDENQEVLRKKRSVVIEKATPKPNFDIQV